MENKKKPKNKIKKKNQTKTNIIKSKNNTKKETRDKTLSIILAIFFSCFTWINTWKIDQTKFWIGLIISICLYWTLIAPLAVWIWAIVDVCVKDKDIYENYQNY